MSLPENPSVSQGTIPGVFELPWPWPPQKPTAIERRLRDGYVTLTIEPIGRMRVRLAMENATPTEIVSCLLLQPTHTATTFCIVWSGAQLELFLNAVLVASTHETIPAQYVFPPVNLSRPMQDFSAENRGAQKRRRDTMGGTHARRGRERADNEYIFRGLSDAIVQVRDMIAHIEQGETAYASSLSSQIRMLIADTKQPTGGLLQWCAAMVDQPLILYTAANPGLLPPKDVGPPVDNIQFNASATPQLLTRNPVDLDVWLDLPAGQISDQLFNNREVIHKVASTIATHFDVDRHPLVGALRDSASQMDSLSGKIDFLVCYIRRVGHVIVHLSEQVLAKKPR